MIPVNENEARRPPISGPGSSVTAWREYAADVTGTPVESWSQLSREEIVAQLDADDTEQLDGVVDLESADDVVALEPDRDSVDFAEPRPEPRPRQRPQWMVPTDDGPVVEHEHNQHTR